MPKVVCTVVIAALAATATADPSRYAHVARVPAQVALSAWVRPSTPGTQVPARPTVDADAVMSIEDLRKPPRAEQEQVLVQLIANTADSDADEKSDYYFRLGTLYAQLNRMWRDRAIAAKTPAEVSAASMRAKDYLLKTVKTMKGLVDNDRFRNYPKMDTALFYYGYTLQGAKYLKEARAVYDKLLKNYPSSKYVAEAHLAFAEYYFDNNQLADAEARYKMVLKFPKSTGYWFAMYKMGWIHLDLQRFQEALETFFEVAQATKADPRATVLNHAAKQDFVRAYAEIGKADKASAAFKRVDPNAAAEMVEVLAQRYAEQGKSDRAAFVYRELIATQPDSPHVCAWAYAAAHAVLSLPGASPSDKVGEIENLVHVWQRVGATLPPADSQTCHDAAGAMSGELARAFHVEADKTKAPETMANAERLYTAYVDAFPDAADRAPMQYLRAETAWAAAETESNARLRADRWEHAADAFAAVDATDRATKRDAALAAVAAWMSALDLDPDLAALAGAVDVPAAVRATPPPPQPLPAREAKLLAAFDASIPVIADQDELARIELVEAIVLRRAHQLDQAVRLLDVVARHAQPDRAALAANLLLESLILLDRDDAARELADRLHADTRMLDGHPELARNVDYVRTHPLHRH